MIDNLIISKSNGYGLSGDVAMVRAAIEAAGGRCEHVTPKSRPFVERLLGRKVARHAFHLERAHPQWFNAAEKHFLIPNQERFPERHLRRLGRFDHVLAKTRHAEKVFSALKVPTAYVGFASLDRRDATIARGHRLLHLAGGSTIKGTEELLALWRRRSDLPELVLVQKKSNAPPETPANVTLRSEYLEESAITELMNACRIHVCPSRSEGWGHYIVEAMSCGAVVITTDGPPMNELVAAAYGLLVPTIREKPRHLGTEFFVDPAALERAIDSALALAPAELTSRSDLARQAYERLRRDFSARMERFVAR